MSAIPMTTQSQFWQPHQYQKDAVKLLISQGCGGLFLDPGLGKTSISLMAFKILKEKGLHQKMLVIAPLRPMAIVWPAEMDKWTDFNSLTYCIVHGAQKEEALETDADVYLINPDAMAWLAENNRFRRLGADVLCVDESTKFKNSSTKRFKAMRGMVPYFKRRWILTGTPAPRSLMDLFGQIYILDQGLALGRFITHYRQQYFYPSGYGGYTWELKLGADVEIAKRVEHITLRLKAEDWLKMPKLVFNDIEVELSPPARKVYRDLEDLFITQIQEEDIVAANAAVAGGKCRQVANGGLYSENESEGTGKRLHHKIHDAKVDALADLVEELQGQPILVLYEFDHDATRIQERLPDIKIINRDTSEKKALEYVAAFNRGELPVLVAHPASAGHGLNLQDYCFRVCWFGLTWNFEFYDQAIRRVYRQGQKSDHVIVYRIIAKDTLDADVIESLKDKENVQAAFVSRLRTFKRK